MSELNPYSAPASSLEDDSDIENTSGMGEGHPIPEGVKGWSWGAFVWGWIWAVSNKTWVGLLCFIPYLGIIVKFYLGIKGRELAWQNKRWDSLEHFNSVQRKWSLWALLIPGVAIIGIIAAIVIPNLHR